MEVEIIHTGNSFWTSVKRLDAVKCSYERDVEIQNQAPFAQAI